MDMAQVGGDGDMPDIEEEVCQCQVGLFCSLAGLFCLYITSH